MKVRKALILAVLAALAGRAGIASAGAFAVIENGAKAQGMAGAFVGHADDPSAVWYNPAGLPRTPTSFVIRVAIHSGYQA